MINLHTALYLTLTALAVVLEHLTFGRWWAGNELARRTMGVMTIMALAVPFVATLAAYMELAEVVRLYMADHNRNARALVAFHLAKAPK